MSSAALGQDVGSTKRLFVLWSERPIPADLRVLLEPDVQAIGGVPGTEPLRGLERADGVIASARIRYDASVFDRAARLRVVARTGTGVDNVDLAEATRRGIAVCNVPDGPTISTAEHAVALLLAVAKRLKRADQSLRTGVWDIFNELDSLELDGTTLGVIGLGKIGSRVARVAHALGMEVLVWDPYVERSSVEAAGAKAAESLDELLAVSDAVTLHAPLTDETLGLLSRERIGLMKPGAIIVNTARGGLLDEPALLDALDQGRLGGAGLDVFAREPLDPDSPLLGRPDIVVTPHVAAATVASRERLWRAAIDDALRCLRGERPRNVLNPEALASRSRPSGADGGR